MTEATATAALESISGMCMLNRRGPFSTVIAHSQQVAGLVMDTINSV